jgi:penicillin-binding protein 1A
MTMGDSWGPGARSALPIVSDVFQQALRSKVIDARAEFDIPRPRPKPPEPEIPIISPPEVIDGITNFLNRLFKGLR